MKLSVSLHETKSSMIWNLPLTTCHKLKKRTFPIARALSCELFQPYPGNALWRAFLSRPRIARTKWMYGDISSILFV